MDDRTESTTKNRSRPGARPGAPLASGGSPRPTDARPLTDLAHEEWCELCDDLERWIDAERAPR